MRFQLLAARTALAALVLGVLLAVVAVVGTVLSGLGAWWADPVAASCVAVGALGAALVLVRQQRQNSREPGRSL